MKKQKNENVSYLSEVLDKLKEHKMAMAGLVILIIESLMVVFLPIILNLDPYTSDYTAFSAAPGGAHILGTDAIGRDVFARLMYGGRTSLLVGFVSTLISCAVGVPLGLVAGYARGKAEAIIMRIADVFMSFPSIVLILVLVAVLGPSVWSVTCVIGVLGWTQFARLIYANVLSVSEKEYVESARAIGTSNFKIVTKYILPNSFPNGKCHSFRIVFKLSWNGRTAAGSKLGKYALRCTVHYRAFPEAVDLASAGTGSFDHGIKH